MSIYNSKKGVQRYIKMCEGYDGQALYNLIKKFIPTGRQLLELGSGPGNDVEFLSSHFTFIGSDFSSHFLDTLQERFPHLSFIKLDAGKVEMTPPVDCIFSNKVLHHLTDDELMTSLPSQHRSLNSSGFIAHSFWLGAGLEKIEGLTFQYYRKESLIELISKYFDILSTYVYGEIEPNDSIFIIAQKRQK